MNRILPLSQATEELEDVFFLEVVVVSEHPKSGIREELNLPLYEGDPKNQREGGNPFWLSLHECWLDF